MGIRDYWVSVNADVRHEVETRFIFFVLLDADG